MPRATVSLKDKYRAESTMRDHQLVADEPVEAGGDDTGPTPVEMLLSALGSCMAITMRLYANRKKWPLESADVDIESQRVKTSELPNYDNKDGRPTVAVITARIKLGGPLTEEQRVRIAEIGGKCPVHKIVAEGACMIDELEVE